MNNKTLIKIIIVLAIVSILFYAAGMPAYSEVLDALTFIGLAIATYRLWKLSE